MSDKIPLDTLNGAERKRLEDILALDNSELTEADRTHLNARRDYLTKEQKEKYEIGKDGAGEKDIEDMTKPELQAKATELGVTFDATETKADLIAKITAKKAETK